MADELISREKALAILEIVVADSQRIAGDNKLVQKCVGIQRNMRNIVAKLPAIDAVSRGLYEQIKYERDIAMEQLAEHGIAFGDKSPDVVSVCRCKDCEYFAESKGKDSGKSCGYGRCEFVSGIIWLVCADDFCSSALRREEDV